MGGMPGRLVRPSRRPRRLGAPSRKGYEFLRPKTRRPREEDPRATASPTSASESHHQTRSGRGRNVTSFSTPAVVSVSVAAHEHLALVGRALRRATDAVVDRERGRASALAVGVVAARAEVPGFLYAVHLRSVARDRVPLPAVRPDDLLRARARHETEHEAHARRHLHRCGAYRLGAVFVGPTAVRTLAREVVAVRHSRDD